MNVSPGTPTLEQTLASPDVLANAETIVKAPGATIVPAQRTLEGARALLAGIRTERAELATRLRVQGTLGQGGMGVVRLAEQTSLGRLVAVKTLREGARADERAVVKMLQEAWITGHLEHPNVVPVHDVHVDEEGRPHIVLKRVEGESWDTLIRDGDRIRRRFGASDPLAWNLAILGQVCNAVAFAHARGIVHRDLKPENVMVGSFGEVYLLDWGIAVSLDASADERFPHVSSATELAGTPSYMAPEMLGGDVRISRATDVYLLGAILYEIVTGRPPHEGGSLGEMIRSVVISSPALPDDVPHELARIIRRAMDPEPDRRFDGALELREALDDFVRHQGSRRLAEEAARRHRELAARLEAAGLSDAPELLEGLQSLFAESRFGYVEALRAWPGNDAAAVGLRELSVCMVEHQLALGHPRVAAASLAGLADPPPELRARVEAAVHAKDAEQRELERLGRDRDPTTGTRTRGFLALVAGIVWTVVPYLLLALGVPERLVPLFAPALVLCAGLGLFLWARESMTKTALNRFVVHAIGGVLAVQVGFTAGAIRLDLARDAILLLTLPLWGFCALTVALVVDRRIHLAAFGYLVAFVVAAMDPSLAFPAATLANAAAALVAVVAWMPHGTLSRWRARVLAARPRGTP